MRAGANVCEKGWGAIEGAMA
eukprot:COSAG05_NODE_11914_length_490_cov_1.314578_1_plen_20_part_10